MRWQAYLAIRLCRVLPPSLAYRAQFQFFSHLVGSSERFDEPVLFGHGRISSTMTDVSDAHFALHRTDSYQGMALARLVITRGETVFELGANSGTETLALANLVGAEGTVVAVEVDPRTANLLHQRIAQNGVRNVHVVEQAVAEAEGSVYFEAGSQQNTGVGFITRKQNRADAIPVKTITIDQLTARFGRPSFMFMDLEGAEYVALMGGRETLKEARPVIFSEVDSSYFERAGASLDQLLRLLSNCGYEVFDARRWFTPRLSERHYSANIHTDCAFVPREKICLIPAMRRLLFLARVLPKLPYLHPIMR